MYEYGTLKPVKVILGRGKRENIVPNWGTLYACMEMSQQNPLYNYYMPIKTLKKEQP
jgi:hypothetical protein